MTEHFISIFLVYISPLIFPILGLFPFLIQLITKAPFLMWFCLFNNFSSAICKSLLHKRHLCNSADHCILLVTLRTSDYTSSSDLTCSSPACSFTQRKWSVQHWFVLKCKISSIILKFTFSPGNYSYCNFKCCFSCHMWKDWYLHFHFSAPTAIKYIFQIAVCVFSSSLLLPDRLRCYFSLLGFLQLMDWEI